MSLLEVLQQAQTPNGQAQAETALKQAEETNFALYVVELAKVLANQQAPVSSRALAGILLKLALSGQSDKFQAKKTERWMTSVPVNDRNACKEACLNVLQAPEFDVSRAAAQAVAAIAQIELPQGEWKDLMTKLTSNVTSTDLQPMQKVASLQALGYICERVEVEVIPSNEVNAILNAIGGSMDDNLPEKLHVAATSAMLNTLEFASNNMSNQNERNMILGLIVKATKSKYESVRVKGYECIVKTASHYYKYLAEYMDGIYESTFKAVREDTEAVGMQALEFWTSLAEEELFLMEEAFENPSTPSQSNNYIQKVGQNLCDLLMNHCLIKQEEDQEEEARNLATAGALCLGYLSQCLKNSILPMILPFVEKNIGDKDWRRREAAVLSFGAMLDGPHPEVLQGPLSSAFTTVMSKMLKQYEPHAMVRDTAAWAISMVCSEHIALLNVAEHLEILLKSLMVALDDEARVARNVAFAINNLAKAFNPVADAATNKLSPVFQHFIAKLLSVTVREDRNEWELAQNCYEAINSLVENAAQDMLPLILKLLEEMLRRLELAVNKVPNTSDEKEEKDQIQMFLCGNIQVMVMKLQGRIIPMGPNAEPNLVLSDKIMELMIKLLAVHNAPCHADCFMVIGALANAVEGNFARYLTSVMEYICLGLNNRDEYQVCQNAVGTVGDICRAVENLIEPYCDKIIEILHSNLKDQHLNRDVKPPTLAVFGDIALAVGPNFEKYLKECMATIFAACQTQVNMEDEDMVDYLNILRENILEACTGIIQGMNGDPDKNIPSKKEVLVQYSDPILHFIASIASEVRDGKVLVAPAVSKGAVGVMGDLCFVLGQPVKDKLIQAQEYIRPLFVACSSSSDQATLQTAQWAGQMCGITP